jgi:hypothetical protein
MAEQVDGYMEGRDIHTRAEFLEERDRLIARFRIYASSPRTSSKRVRRLSSDGR